MRVIKSNGAGRKPAQKRGVTSTLNPADLAEIDPFGTSEDVRTVLGLPRGDRFTNWQ